jgi:phytanoyl-CoA hydroxylase
MGPTKSQISRFREDGFLVVDAFVDPDLAARAAACFEPLFDNRFETGIAPDMQGWGQREIEPLNRQIGSPWKSDRTIAALVLREETGRWCATLAGWSGARVNQSDLVWRPPGADAVAMHQDLSYNPWYTPQEMTNCWVALTPTSSGAGTLEYVRGSHKWGYRPISRQDLYGSGDYRFDMRAAADAAGVEPEIVSVEVPLGGAAFHHGLIWHGSDENRDPVRDRRALTTVCCPRESRFYPDRVTGELGIVFLPLQASRRRPDGRQLFSDPVV